MTEDGHELIVAGDLNIDRHPPNDPCSQPEIKALNPLLEDFLITNNVTPVNHKPTRHQVGCGSSLLNLVLTNISERISNAENIINTLSKHEGVRSILKLKMQSNNLKVCF